MKLLEPTNQEIEEYTNKPEESRIHIPKPKQLINLDDQEYRRQISDVVKKWVLHKAKSWQERMRIIIENEKNVSKIWQL